MSSTLRRIRSVFLAMAAVLAVSVAVIFYGGQRALRAHQSSIATHRVMDDLQQLFSSLQDAETGQRGYLLTGRQEYLHPYEEALKRIEQELAAVRAWASQGRLDATAVGKISQLVQDKLAELHTTIVTDRAEGSQAAMALVNDDSGRRIMSRLRELTTAQVTKLRQDLDASSRHVRAWTIGRIVIFAVAGVLNAAFLLWAYAIVRHVMAAREAAADAVAREKERFRVTLASIGDAVIVSDPAARIVFLNDVARKLTGWEKDTAIGRPLEEVFRIIAEDTRTPSESPVSMVLREGVVVGLANHTLLIRKDGTEIPIDDSGAPVRSTSGAILGVVLVFRDVSDHREHERRVADSLERERSAREQAERANRVKDEFLAALSHELRTPLTPALFSLTMLADNREVPQSVREELHSVRHHIEMEARLIDDLLDLTRVSTGRLKLVLRTVDLHAILTNAAHVARPDGGSSGVRQVVELSAAKFHVHGDGARLQQVFWNLLSNAHKFTPIGGTVTLKTSNPRDGVVRVEVTDTGRGIEPDILPRVFDAFEQGEASTARQFGGLGLGLAIARQIVAAHGGEIHAYSEGKGCGSTFAVELETVAAPPAPVRPATPSIAPPASRAGRKLRVLVVEDHEPTLKILTRILQMLGHEAAGAGDVRSAIAAADRGEFDLLISDVGLPDGTGHEVMRHVRDKHGTPGIALSGYGMSEDISRSEDAGFAMHLTKPIDMHRLSAAIIETATRTSP
jgi:PAS domain S-box-containing protein